MMPIDERTERLIVRKLDGELSSQEELELNKLLIRCPEARDLLDVYADQDSGCALLLAEEVGAPTMPHMALVAAGAASLMRPVAHRRPWTASSLGGLMVACLAMFVVLWQPIFSPNRGSEPESANLAGSAVMAAPAKIGDEFQALPARFTIPQVEEQVVNRQFIGVYDEKTGQYYVLEVRRTQTKTNLLSAGF